MMRKSALTLNLCFVLVQFVSGQVEVIGRVVDEISGEFLANVKINCLGCPGYELSDIGGYFKIKKLKLENDSLVFELKGYELLKISIKPGMSKLPINLGFISLSKLYQQSELDHSLEQYEIDNYAGLLSSNKNLFTKTVAYDFSSNFFRSRFLNSDQMTIMLNNVPLNKIYTGRPEWSNWGGLNDALRQQVSVDYMQSPQFNLGGLSNSMSMISSALQQKKGIKLSMAMSNKNYQSRFMATYKSGFQRNGWAYIISASIRLANEGFRSGTNYNAYSLMASVDKKFGKKNRLNVTWIHALNTRGKSSPLTQEVFEMKNLRYNSYWGYQQNQKRNSREKRIEEPIFQVNHQFNPNSKTVIYNHFTYQTGVSASSRLDYGGGRFLENNQLLVGGGTNPDPTYYQNLPSYFLKDVLKPDYARAYLAEKKFKKEGQIKWNELYQLNTSYFKNQHSIYALYSDERSAKLMAFNTNISTKISDRISFNGGLSLRRNFSKNYARMNDLLGGIGYLDVDLYAKSLFEAQNNLKTPNRIVKEQEKFRYNYELESNEFSVFLKSTFSSRRVEVYLGTQFISVDFQRKGLFENGFFPGSLSLGDSKKVKFFPFGLKTGFSYSLNGRHIIAASFNYLEKAPIFNHIFSNARVSNEIVRNLQKEKNLGVDLKYIWRSPYFLMHISGYYLLLNEASRISFYYADGLTGIENAASSAYVQEILSGIDQRNMGLEFSIEIPIVANMKIKSVVAIGNSNYSSNPELYLTSNTFSKPLILGNSYLKGYYSSNGPQRAYSMGLEYSSPDYWWLSCSFNFFDKSFLSIAPITRTMNFFLDTDGLPVNDIDTDLAKNLLDQEALPSYGSINLVGGKSWKINNLYLGLFVAINNLTNNIYKTGGFEQSRTANYLTLKEDNLRDKPLFGPKYWFGFGTTFFTSFYIRI